MTCQSLADGLMQTNCMNSSKTKTMLFSSNQSHLKEQNSMVMVNGETLESVHSFKYLGVEIDRHLSFEKHVNRICCKVNQQTGLLWRIRPFITTPLAKELCVSLIEPHFLYSDFIYDGCSKSSSVKLYRSVKIRPLEQW